MFTSVDKIKYYMRNWSWDRITLDEGKNVQVSHSAHTNNTKALSVSMMFLEGVKCHLEND